MASLRTPSLRHIARHTLRHQTQTQHQRRWAQVHDIRRSLATAHPSQSVLDKYRSKLEDKARSEGHPSIEDLKTAYAGKIQDLHRKDAVEFPEAATLNIPQAPHTPVKQPNRGPLDTNGTDSGEDLPKETPQAPGSDDVLPNDPDPPAIPKHTPVTQPNKDTPSPSSSAASDVSAAARRVTGDKPAVKGLDDIIDLSKARTLPDKELTAIWRLRHANSPQNICAVIPAAAYRAMEDAARTSPQFVLPVPHESQGAEIHFLQWTFDAPSQTSTVLFTQLAEFKVRGEFAQPHTTITHHLDLLEERGLVMMQGQVMDGRGVSPEQARWLVMCLQRFYGGWESEVQASELTGERKQRADERRKLLDWFASGDERFTVEKLLEEAERVG
jgi:ATP synthase mitochondrial F1 complex assembly factor 1